MHRLWAGTTKYSNGTPNGHGAFPTPRDLLQHKIDTLLQLEDLSDLFSRAFLAPSKHGGVDISVTIRPELTEQVAELRREAQSKMEVRPCG